MEVSMRGFLILITASTLLSACWSSSGDDAPNVNGLPTLLNVYSYQSSDISEQVLTCARLFLDNDSCDLAVIRPIGVEIDVDDVSLDDIKQRLVVSHDWMADSFIAALQEINDQDFLNLFKPLNTVVLSYDIIPSFYHLYTASIYIDARYLWRSSDEWNTIYQQDDYRSDYGNELLFSSAARYVDSSSDYVLWSNSYDVDSYTSRSVAQISPGLFRLLSHELAHANDYLPTEVLSSMGDQGSIYATYIALGENINSELNESYPLTSDLLFDVAKVNYGGTTASEEITETTAEQAGDEFEYDGAASLYGYYRDAEDVAMLFEAFMMYKKYGAVRDVAFVTIPSQVTSCDDYLVEWGQRHRLADSSVKQRAIFIANRILDRDVNDDLSAISDSPISMQTNTGWCTSRTNTASATGEASSATLSSREQPVVHNYQDDFIDEHSQCVFERVCRIVGVLE